MQFLTPITRTLLYRWGMWRAGASESYIRKAYSTLAQMDIGQDCGGPTPNPFYNGGNEWISVPGGEISFAAAGNIVQIKDGPNFHITISENKDGEVYVHELRSMARGFKPNQELDTYSKWWEVYRSGHFIHSDKFIKYLKILYGDGSYNKG